MTRLWAGTQADALGYRDLAAIVRVTGLASSTVQQGYPYSEPLLGRALGHGADDAHGTPAGT